MSFATINDVAINSGVIKLGLIGAWEATAKVSTDDPLAVSGAVDLVVAGTTLKGTASIAEADRGNLVTVRIVGGKGGLNAQCPPHPYLGTTRGVLLTDILAVGKETLSATSDALVTATPLTRWTRVLDTVGGALKRALRDTGANWRVLPDGSFWVGKETWSVVELEASVESETPTQKRLTLALETLGVMPGQTYAGHQISSVEYHLDDRRLRADLSYAVGRTGVAAELSTFVKRELGAVDLMRTQSAQVVGQNADGTLELKVHDERIPNLSKVPFRTGIPGLTSFTVAPGIQCLLVHEDGDEQKPVVTGFAQGQALSVKIEAVEATVGLALGAQFAALANLVDQNNQTLAALLATVSYTPGPKPIGPFVPVPTGSKTVRLGV